MTEPNSDSSACLHHPSRSVGWNCSNIAAYPTVPVGFMSLPSVAQHFSTLSPSGFACQHFSMSASPWMEHPLLHRTLVYSGTNVCRSGHAAAHQQADMLTG